jgi:periplasmic divalent cation tolerance protein
LRERIATLHPYQVPEIIALPLVAGSAPYLDWIRQSTGQPVDGQ